MVRRDLYINQLKRYINKPVIKVITGIRRSGKSAILMMLRDELSGMGIDEENIIYLNFESFEFSEIDRADKLHSFVKSRIINSNRYYLLLDEIQEVELWEKAVNSFLVDFNVDIYITGSNSRLLSSELATYLAGRYIEIHLFTLSFKEYLMFRKELNRKVEGNIYQEFGRFLQMGGFPVLGTGEYSLESAGKIVFDIYSSVILRDTVQRHRIRDVELLERVVRFVFENTGNKFSAKNVADYFKSQQRRIDLNTVYNYLDALEGAFIIYRIPRYDVKGREILKTFEKYFVADQSLIYAVLGYRDRFISGVLENIIMLELKRRGYNVFVGKSDEKEIDFIAEIKGEKVYVQVASRLSEKTTREREFSPLHEIKDNYPKYLVTMDETLQDNVEGIKQIHIADFLIMEEY